MTRAQTTLLIAMAKGITYLLREDNYRDQSAFGFIKSIEENIEEVGRRTRIYEKETC